MKIAKSKIKNTTNIYKPKRNISLILLLGLAVIALSLGLFYGLSNVFKTTTYYVLRNDVAAKTQITTNMLAGQTTSAGTQPKNALNIQQVQSGKLYSKYALEKGDVISKSNVGAQQQEATGIPDDWIVTSFTAKATDSVDGRIQRGTYFDIIGIDDNGNARYLFTDVLDLDATSTVSGTKNDASASYQYTVGMPQKDAPLLLGAIKSYSQIKLVLSPKSISYKTRDTKGLGDVVKFSNSDPGNKDLYKGTDSTFKSIKRDKNGKPITSNKQKTNKDK